MNTENIWLGTSYGLVKFTGSEWTVYDQNNSGLPSNKVYCTAIDSNQHVWTGTDYGLATFDGSSWAVYDMNNSALPWDMISSIKIDTSNTKWIGMSEILFPFPVGNGGLAKFDGSEWTIFNHINSGLIGERVHTVAIDKNNNKWIGSSGGLSVFNENGIEFGIENEKEREENMFTIYPNPATTQIYIDCQTGGIVSVYNLQGKTMFKCFLEHQRIMVMFGIKV